MKAKGRNDIVKRKHDHLKITVRKRVQVGSAGFERYRLIHNELPEINFGKVEADALVVYPNPIQEVIQLGGTVVGRICWRSLNKLSGK